MPSDTYQHCYVLGTRLVLCFNLSLVVSACFGIQMLIDRWFLFALLLAAAITKTVLGQVLIANINLGGAWDAALSQMVILVTRG